MKNYLSVTLLALTLTGCSTLTENEKSVVDNIAIEIVDSVRASIGDVKVEKIQSSLQVSGKVRSKKLRRGPIFGHVHIEAIGANEQLLITSVERLITSAARYKRQSTKSRVAHFSTNLNVNPASTKKIRITHSAKRHYH